MKLFIVFAAFIAVTLAAKTKKPIAEYFSDFAGEEDIHLITNDDNRPPTNFMGDLTKAKTTSIKTSQGSNKFNYNFETQNGINVVSIGKLKDDKTFVVSGSYSYTGADGKRYRVRYTADEFGYHPVTELDDTPEVEIAPLPTPAPQPRPSFSPLPAFQNNNKFGKNDNKHSDNDGYVTKKPLTGINGLNNKDNLNGLGLNKFGNQNVVTIKSNNNLQNKFTNDNLEYTDENGYVTKKPLNGINGLNKEQDFGNLHGLVNQESFANKPSNHAQIGSNNGQLLNNQQSFNNNKQGLNNAQGFGNSQTFNGVNTQGFNSGLERGKGSAFNNGQSLNNQQGLNGGSAFSQGHSFGNGQKVNKVSGFTSVQGFNNNGQSFNKQISFNGQSVNNGQDSVNGFNKGPNSISGQSFNSGNSFGQNNGHIGIDLIAPAQFNNGNSFNGASHGINTGNSINDILDSFDNSNKGVTQNNLVFNKQFVTERVSTEATPNRLYLPAAPTYLPPLGRRQQY